MENNQENITNNNNAVNLDNGELFASPSAEMAPQTPSYPIVETAVTLNKADDISRKVKDFCADPENEKLLLGIKRAKEGSEVMLIIFCLLFGMFISKLKKYIPHGSFTKELEAEMEARGIRRSTRMVHIYRKSYEAAIMEKPALDNFLKDARGELKNNQESSSLSNELIGKIFGELNSLKTDVPHLKDYLGKNVRGAKEAKKSRQQSTMDVARQAINRRISSSLKRIEGNKELVAQLKKVFGSTIHPRKEIPLAETIQTMEKFIDILKGIENADQQNPQNPS